MGGARGPRQSSPAPRGGPTRTASCPPGPNGVDRRPHPGVSIPIVVADRRHHGIPTGSGTRT
eukprot:5038800-Pyramimonas_sp.AAC.1